MTRDLVPKTSRTVSPDTVNTVLQLVGSQLERMPGSSTVPHHGKIKSSAFETLHSVVALSSKIHGIVVLSLPLNYKT